MLQLLAKLGIACREASDNAGLPATCRIQAVLLGDAADTLLVLFPQNQLLDLARLTELTGRKLLAIEPECLERMFDKYELHRLSALPPLTSSPCLYDERLLQGLRLLTGSGQPDILPEIASNDSHGLLDKTGTACFGEPLESVNLNLNCPDDGRTEINQAVQIFTTRRIRQRLEQTIEVPPLPQVAREVIKLRVGPNASVDDITGLVETDPALTAQVVSQATSPYYATPGRIRLVENAIIRVLGFGLVTNLALGLALDKSLDLPKSQPQQVTSYWQQAIYTVAMIEGLTHAMPCELRPKSDLSYLDGLLHNFGYLVLVHVSPPRFSLICRHLEINPHLGYACIEQHLLGITRKQIGAWLMHVWDMPDNLYYTLRFQQDPNYAGPNAVYANLTYLTNRSLRSSGIGNGLQQAIPAALHEHLRIIPGKAGGAVERVLKTGVALRELATQFNHLPG